MNMPIIIVLGIVAVLVVSGCVIQSSEKCGIEYCHGLEITCGPNVPDACTELYAFGDRCRQFATCQSIDGECQLATGEEFENCESCVEECSQYFGEGVDKAFECESRCDGKPEPPTESYCVEYADCACGVHINTGECFSGNKRYVNTSEQCPDYCGGIAGNLRTRCVNNECRQVSAI